MSAGAIAGAEVIGLNPVARGMTETYALDPCAAGNVTLEFGNNELIGGSVASTFTLVIPSARVTAPIDGAELVRKGALA